VVGIDEYRVGDVLGETANGFDVLVDRNRDDLEVLVGQFVLKCLPPGQVKGASSPG